MRRLLALIMVAALGVSSPVSAAAPTPEVPPAGTVVLVVLVSDGTAVLPFGQAVVPPSGCLP